MRCLPAAKPLRMLNGRFRCWPRTAPDPQQTFASRAGQRQLTDDCRRSARRLNANSSAKADFGPLARIGRLCASYLSLSR